MVSAPVTDAWLQPTRSKRPPLSPGRGAAVWALATLSLLAVWLIVYAFVLTSFEAARSQTVLYSKARETLALQTAPLGGLIEPRTPVAVISAPALGINDLVIVEGTASGDLMTGPGHRRDTVLPGQAGVSVVYGRSTLFGGPFGQLGAARKGDSITVTTGQGVFEFKVLKVRRAGGALLPVLAVGKGRLTLVSGNGSGFGALMSPNGAVYVDAALVGDAQPSPGHPSGVPFAETAMQGDAGSMLSLVLALPLLMGAFVFVVWARSRWGGWQAWLVGAPLILAGLWIVSQATVQLLPNLL